MRKTKSEGRSISFCHENMVKLNQVKRMIEEKAGVKISYMQAMTYIFEHYEKAKTILKQ